MATQPTSASTPSSNTPASTPAAVPAAKSAAVDPKSVGQVPVAADPKAAPVAEETFDVQENGKTVKKTRKEVIEAYQLRQLSDKKRSEADKTLAEYNKLFQTLKGDPIKFLKAAGIDFDNMATGYLSKKAEEAMLDPKEKEARAQKAELEQYKRYVEEQKAQQEQSKARAAVEHERSKIHAEIVEAIEANKELGLPVDEEMVIAIAQKMILQDKKQKPLNAKEALPAAYASTQKWLQGMASKMEGEALINWLGKDIALKIRKHDLSQLKKSRTAPAQGSLVKPKEGQAKPAAKPYKTWSEFKAEKLDTLQ